MYWSKKRYHKNTAVTLHTITVIKAPDVGVKGQMLHRSEQFKA